MSALFAAILLALPSSTQAAAEPRFDQTHAAWTKLLRAHVEPGGVDYAGFQREIGELEAYLRTLEAVTPEQFAEFTREQRFAFWIDAYNAYTVHLVASKYPVASIRNLGSVFQKVWDKEFIPLGRLDPETKGRLLSLDRLEHGILRPRFEDARVHAAINCASVSCPPLRAEAFVAERLDEQLDEQARAWLADPGRNRFDRTATTVHLSKIFDWFQADFVRDAGSVQAWVARYAPPADAEWIERAKDLKIRYLDYDWSLNDAPR